MSVRERGLVGCGAWDAFLGLVVMMYTLTAVLLGYSLLLTVMTP